MRFKKAFTVFAIAVATVLSGCGGGGGSAGSSASGAAATGTTPTEIKPITATASLVLELRDDSGRLSSSINPVGNTSLRAILKNADGTPIVQKLVTISGDVTQVVFPDGVSALSDNMGIAVFKLAKAGISSVGAGNITVTFTASTNGLIAGTNVIQTIAYQLTPGNVALSDLNLGTGSLTIFGNRPIAATATVNGVVAASTPLQVSFSASCGSVSPSSVTTGASGIANTTYSADNFLCAGTRVTLTASAVGANVVVGTIDIPAALATNIQFVDAAPQLIYLQNSGAATQSQLRFKVVDSAGMALSNQAVLLSLTNTNTDLGLGIDTVKNITPVEKSTGSNGIVSVAIFSGNVPTSTTVKAVLKSNGSVSTSSNILTVASGIPVPSRASLALEKLSIEGFDTDNVSSKITLSLADRQGNPVPEGTAVNFVTQAGVVIPARGVVDNNSKVVAEIFSRGVRPTSGLVSILAYVPGEEDFVDVNANNKYDVGESFLDLGDAFRDDNKNNIFDIGEFSVPRGGVLNCTDKTPFNSRPDTCDGKWGQTDVRVQTVIVFATGRARVTVLSSAFDNFVVSISDLNGNSMPTGTVVSAEKQSGGDACIVKKVTPSLIGNVSGPAMVAIDLEKCSPGVPPNPNATPPVAGVAADRIRVIVTSPLKVETSISTLLTAN